MRQASGVTGSSDLQGFLEVLTHLLRACSDSNMGEDIRGGGCQHCCHVLLQGNSSQHGIPGILTLSQEHLFSHYTPPIRRSGALLQTLHGSPPACPDLGFPSPCE